MGALQSAFGALFSVVFSALGIGSTGLSLCAGPCCPCCACCMCCLLFTAAVISAIAIPFAFITPATTTAPGKGLPVGSTNANIRLANIAEIYQTGAGRAFAHSGREIGAGMTPASCFGKTFNFTEAETNIINYFLSIPIAGSISNNFNFSYNCNITSKVLIRGLEFDMFSEVIYFNETKIAKAVDKVKILEDPPQPGFTFKYPEKVDISLTGRWGTLEGAIEVADQCIISVHNKNDSNFGQVDKSNAKQCFYRIEPGQTTTFASEIETDTPGDEGRDFEEFIDIENDSFDIKRGLF